MQPEKPISKPSNQKDLVLIRLHSYIQASGLHLSIAVLNNTNLQVSLTQTLFAADLESFSLPLPIFKKARVNGQLSLEARPVGIISCSFPDLHPNDEHLC